MINKLTLPWPVLFLEFFVREVAFKGKGIVRSTLPADAHFYTGGSKALRYHLQPGNQWPNYIWHDDIGDIVPFPLHSLPLTLTANRPTFNSRELADKWMKDNIHTAVIMAGEFLSANEWIRRKNQLKTSVHPASVASFAPYGFNINQCDDDGTLWTNFPRPHIKLKITPGKTACFLCRREELLFGYDEAHNHYQPNLNLVLFVKNHGLHKDVYLKSHDDKSEYDSRILCNEKFTTYDFRKNRSRYSF